MRLRTRYVAAAGALLFVVLFFTSQVEILSAVQKLNPKECSKKYYLSGDHVDAGYLSHVIKVFERAGYSRSYDPDSWSVLWSHLYPFGEPPRKYYGNFLKTLPAGLRVNKIPGTGWVSSKQALSKLTNYKYMPTAFELPSQFNKFNEYAKANPEGHWVVKSGKHRNIKIVEARDFLKLRSTKEQFVQRLVEPPMIIDKKKFDIGIYTVVTSIDPLRVYMLQSEWLIRFCKDEYEPFDPNNVDSYVVGDDYTTIWDIPTLNAYMENGSSMKQALLRYMKASGKNIDEFQNKFKEAVAQVWELQREKILNVYKNYQVKEGQMFEMFRMDFVIDEDANIFLLEVNMSPNLSSQSHPPNAPIYESVLQNMFQLVGLTSTFLPATWEVSFCHNDSNLDCHKNPFCLNCLTPSQINTVNQLTSEMLYRGNFELVSPSAHRELLLQPTALDKFQLGFIKKYCEHDSRWCEIQSNSN